MVRGMFQPNFFISFRGDMDKVYEWLLFWTPSFLFGYLIYLTYALGYIPHLFIFYSDGIGCEKVSSVFGGLEIAILTRP